MAEPTNTTGKAALLIIDNQTGFFGMGAATMNRIDEEVFSGLLRPHYDQVIIVETHDRQAKNNEVVVALKRAASRYGVVDMYVHMHTNMETGTLAQVSVSAFDHALTNEERKHLRLLYSMGCGDGNAVSAIVAQQIGFKTFVGHEGNESASPLFAYPTFSRWLDGDDWYSWFPQWLDHDDKISESAAETYGEIKECLPKIGNGVIDHWGEFQKIAAAAVSCSQEGNAKNADETIACVTQKVPEAKNVVRDVLATAADCMPELADIAGKHVKEVQKTVGTARWEVPDIIEAAVKATREDASEYIREKLDLWLRATKPFVAGADIEFDDKHPQENNRTRSKAIEELVGIFRSNTDDFSIWSASARPAFALAQLGAERELEALARDKNMPIVKRFISILALMEKDAKHFNLLMEILQEPEAVDAEDVEIKMGSGAALYVGRALAARNIVVWNLENSDALWKVAQESDVEFLRVEALVKLMHNGNLTAEQLKDIWYWRGKHTAIANDKSAIEFLQRVDLHELMENHHSEAIPVMREIFANADTDHNNVYSAMFEITLHHRYSFEDFSDSFYQLVVNTDRFKNMCENGSCDERLFQIYQNRRRILGDMKQDPKGRDLLIIISRRVIRESDNPLLKLAACLYLHDKKTMSDAEFTSITGLRRKDIDEEGDVDIFTKVFDRKLRYLDQASSQK